MFLQYQMKQITIFVIDFNAVRRGCVVVAAALVPQGLGWNDNAAVLNGTVQYPAIAEQDQLSHAHDNHVLKISNTGRLPHPGFKEGKILSFVGDGIDGLFSVGPAHPGKLLRFKEGKHRLKQMMRKTGDGDFRIKIRFVLYAHIRIDHSVLTWIKFFQKDHVTPLF